MSNEAAEMEGRLGPGQLELLRRASVAAASSGVAVFLVGGTVRDILLDKTPEDLDIVSQGAPEGFPAALAAALGGEVASRSQFGTAKLRAGGVSVDLASARRETYSRPGALPQVSPGSMGEDLARRDFSLNAMAISLGAGTWGELLDPFDGRADVRRGVVRVLHADSFVDDATRLLRAVRYSIRLGFRLDEETERLARRDSRYLDSISGDRARHELRRVLREPAAVSMLEAAQGMGLLAALHPGLRVPDAVPQGMQDLSRPPPEESELRLLAALVTSAPAAELPSVIERLNMDGRWSRVVRDAGAVRGDSERLGAEGLRRSEVYAMLRHRHPAAVEGCAAATGDATVRERLGLYLDELRDVRPALRGGDLLALGVPQGPAVGELLARLHSARLDGELSTKGEEEDLVRRSLQERG